MADTLCSIACTHQVNTTRAFFVYCYCTVLGVLLSSGGNSVDCLSEESVSTAATSSLSPTSSSTATMERRGSRARRRQLSGPAVDTSLPAADSDRCGEEVPVVNTTSVEVERKADGEILSIVFLHSGRGTAAAINTMNTVRTSFRERVERDLCLALPWQYYS